MIDIEKLKQAAIAATQGEWSTKYSLHYSNCHVVSNKGIGRGICLAQQDKDASFIAAANPSAVLELITRLEAAESKQILGASARHFKQMEAAESQQVAQELVIQQLRDALIHHQKLTRPVNRSYEALAIPTSTEHLEAWYKEMVGEPTGYYFRDDPEKFAMPGSGYSHDYPTEALDVVPLHAIKPFPFKEK